MRTTYHAFISKCYILLHSEVEPSSIEFICRCCIFPGLLYTVRYCTVLYGTVRYCTVERNLFEISIVLFEIKRVEIRVNNFPFVRHALCLNNPKAWKNNKKKSSEKFQSPHCILGGISRLFIVSVFSKYSYFSFPPNRKCLLCARLSCSNCLRSPWTGNLKQVSSNWTGF